MKAANNSDQFLERLRILVREKRIDSGKTQIELANQVEGLQQSAIARLETGRSENIGIKTLYEIALAIGLPLSEIISQAEGIRKKEKITNDDGWLKLEQTIKLLSSAKKKWLANIVQTIISGPK